MIPPRAQWFQDRIETDRPAKSGTAVVEPADQALRGSRVLVGMGGVGKTQLAAHYARTAWQAGELDVLVWITAGSRSAAVAGYAQAAVEVLGADPADPESAAKTFLAWLEPKPHQRACRWLVVLDDVADPADLRGLWPPAGPHGRTLVTTRRKDAALTAGGRRLIDIGLFSPAQALAYLTNALAEYDRTEPEQQLVALAHDLGRLPLALSQAAAYLVDTGSSCTAYRALLADRTRSLADAAPDALPDDQTHTVAAAWSLSLDRADTLRPVGLARPVLHLAAFLDPNGIPGTVLTSPPALADLTHHLRPITGQITAEQVVLALAALRRLSLIDHTPDTPHRAVRVHQLIQRAVRDTLDPGHHDQLARTAADALRAAWPDVERDTDLAQALRANTTALTLSAGDALYGADVHSVLYRAGRSLGEAGQAAAARDHFHHLVATATRKLGPDNPFTLAARNNLAYWMGETGAAAGAAAAYAGLLGDSTRVLGPDHPHTLTTRHNLAFRRGEAGDAAGAAAAFAELLGDYLRVHGPDHPETLSTRANLAYWLGESGDVAGAAAAFAELLEDRIRVQGPDHAHTLTAANHLAYWRGKAGDAAGAATVTAELLDHYLRVFGPDHPETLVTRGNLARWRGETGDAAWAAAAIAELLDDCLRVLGPDHLSTLNTRGNLAFWRRRTGDATGAAAAYAELLDDCLRLLGPDHPETLATRGNLAYQLGESGDAAGAAAATAELLGDFLRVHGADHPRILTVRRNLAYWLGESGDAAGAAAAFAALLADRIRLQGPDHPDTLTARGKLANWRGEAGDPAGAAAATAELLHDCLRVLGPDHPETLTARHSLAYWLGETGDPAGAAAATAELLDDCLRVLGPDHPETLNTRRVLAHWRRVVSDTGAG